jgi:hypothetical protein
MVPSDAPSDDADPFTTTGRAFEPLSRMNRSVGSYQVTGSVVTSEPADGMIAPSAVAAGTRLHMRSLMTTVTASSPNNAVAAQVAGNSTNATLAEVWNRIAVHSPPRLAGTAT